MRVVGRSDAACRGESGAVLVVESGGVSLSLFDGSAGGDGIVMYRY